jgi:diaminobutyrate-2-oxoglutarate transaminase
VEWLQQLEAVCRAFDILLIVDDIQVGCGRTGPFFSFERAGIQPDIVVLSKSISGMGLPMSLLLIKPAVDQWEAGEHTGTFRGNNLAFVTATRALRYWEGDGLKSAVSQKGEILGEGLRQIARECAEMDVRVRGIGLIYGLEMPNGDLARHVSRTAFGHGLVIERCGADGQVVKFIPPLLVDDEVLREGLDIFKRSMMTALVAR